MYFSVKGRKLKCKNCGVKLTDGNISVASASENLCQDCHTDKK